jgi:hypothetical protein
MTLGRYGHLPPERSRDCVGEQMEAMSRREGRSRWVKMA